MLILELEFPSDLFNGATFPPLKDEVSNVIFDLNLNLSGIFSVRIFTFEMLNSSIAKIMS